MPDSPRTLFGAAGVVELTALIGYYSMVVMTLNAHEIPVPEGAPAPLGARTKTSSPAPCAST